MQLFEQRPFVLDATNKGSSDLNHNLIKASYIFEGPKVGADVTIIVGLPDESGEVPLLLMRFHHIPRSYVLNDDARQSLYEDLMKLSGKKGYDVARKGGSSGRARYDKHLLDFLKKKNVFPRPSRFVKLINHGLEWECLYITPYHWDNDKEGMKREIWNMRHPDAPIDEAHPFRAAQAFYAPPWPGGQVDMTAEIVTKYPFLYWFADVKLQSAYILQYLNGRSWRSARSSRSSLTPESFDFRGMVAQEAAQVEINHLLLAVRDYHTNKLDTLKTHPSMSYRQHVLTQVMKLNTFTVVTHPVGNHKDHFHGGGASLENKTTFVYRRQQQSFGRGGNGGAFTWALLDWKNSNAGERRRAYLAAGGDARQALRRQFWENWLREGNNLHNLVARVPNMRGSDLIPEGELRDLSQQVVAAVEEV